MALPKCPQPVHEFHPAWWLSPEGRKPTTSNTEDIVGHEIGNGGLPRWSKASSDAYNLDEEGIVLLPPISTCNLRSPSTVSPRIVRFSTRQITTNASAIQEWFERAGVSVLHVGFEYENSWDVVVVDGQRLQSLLETADAFTIVGINPTKVGASKCFLGNALNAIFHTTDCCTSWYYRSLAQQSGLLARLEVLVFCVEFKNSAWAVQYSFAQNALLLGLEVLGEFVSSVACELLRRDFEDWYRYILDGVTSLHGRPLPNHLQHRTREEIELEVVSLLYELLIISGGKIANPKKIRFDPGLTRLTPLDILILYGHAFGVQTPTPQQFGNFDLSALQKTLSRSRIFVKVTNEKKIRTTAVSEVREWIFNLMESLPIAYPDLGLPRPLLNEFTFQGMRQFQVFCEHTHEQLPSLNQSENNILLLLVWSCDCTGRALRALHAWATSEHGQAVYRRLVEHLSLPKTPAQIALSLAALLSFLRLQPYSSSSKDEAEANHLSDFHSLLKGAPSSNSRETLEHASWSFWFEISNWIDATEGQKLFQLLAFVLNPTSTPEYSDKDLALYWGSKFNPPRSHFDALSTIPNVRKELALPINSDLLRLDEKCATGEIQVACGKSSQAGGNQSSEALIQSTEKSIKRRGCWGCAWF